MNKILEKESWRKYNIEDEDKLDEYINFIKSIVDLGERDLSLSDNHHIIPRCVDDSLSYDNSNIVKLRPREHFIAHMMLPNIFGGQAKYKLMFAACYMRYNPIREEYYDITPDEYEKLIEFKREAFSNIKKDRELTEREMEQLDNLHKSNIGRKRSDETRKKIGDSQRGKKLSEDHKMLIGHNSKKHITGTKYMNDGVKNYRVHEEDIQDRLNEGLVFGRLQTGNINKFVRTEEMRANMSRSARGKKMPDGYGEKMSKLMTGKKRGPYNKRDGRYMNDGVHSKYISIEEIPYYESIGWVIGRRPIK